MVAGCSRQTLLRSCSTLGFTWKCATECRTVYSQYLTANLLLVSMHGGWHAFKDYSPLFKSVLLALHEVDRLQVNILYSRANRTTRRKRVLNQDGANRNVFRFNSNCIVIRPPIFYIIITQQPYSPKVRNNNRVAPSVMPIPV